MLLSKYPHHARILVIGAECMQERGSSRCRERVRRLGQLPLDLGMFARVRYLTTIGEECKVVPVGDAYLGCSVNMTNSKCDADFLCM